MHFLVDSSSQRIVGNLMVTNRSCLVLKFENVTNTDFLATPFFGASDRGNFSSIPFLSLYNHVWCLNRGFVSHWNVLGIHFTWKPTFTLVWGQNPDFKLHEENFHIFLYNHTFDSPYNNVWYLNSGFVTCWIVSRGLFYMKTHIYPSLGTVPGF